MKVKFSLDGGFCPNAEEGKSFRIKMTASIPKTSESPEYLYFFKRKDYEVSYENTEDEHSANFHASFYSDSMEDLKSKIDTAIEDYKRQLEIHINMWQAMKLAFEECKKKNMEQCVVPM